MSTRRDFLKWGLLGGSAFGLGLLGGAGRLVTVPGESGGSWDLIARVPAGRGALDELKELATRLGLAWQESGLRSLAPGHGADLALLRDGSLLSPGDFPETASELRHSWQHREAASWLQLSPVRQKRASRARVTGGGSHTLLDLGHDGEIAMLGRDGRRLVLSIRDGGIAVLESACSHKLCQLQGRVELCGERLVCAPAALLVELEA